MADLAHRVHVGVTGWAADEEWFVPFHAEGWSLPVGRGRTLPGSGTGALRFGFVSCQKYTGLVPARPAPTGPPPPPGGPPTAGPAVAVTAPAAFTG